MKHLSKKIHLFTSSEYYSCSQLLRLNLSFSRANTLGTVGLSADESTRITNIEALRDLERTKKTQEQDAESKASPGFYADNTTIQIASCSNMCTLKTETNNKHYFVD